MAVAALAFCVPLAAGAQAESSLGGSSLTEQAESQAQNSTAKTTTTSRESSNNTSNSNTTILIGTIVAVAILIGIGYVIVRDARRRAPVTDAELDAEETRLRHDRSEEMRRRRAKAKAAKQQRKKNR